MRLSFRNILSLTEESKIITKEIKSLLTQDREVTTERFYHRETDIKQLKKEM